MSPIFTTKPDLTNADSCGILVEVDMTPERIKELKRIVLAGGGHWVGIQETFEPPALVMFNNPNTNTTLGLFEDVITAERVHARIVQNDRDVASAPVKLNRQKYNAVVGALTDALAILQEKK